MSENGVSVIIPTFNRAKFLRSTLICLCNQKEIPCNYEIVIIDSGNDDTENFVRSFQSHYGNIVYRKIKNNKNRSLLRNTGAKLAMFDILCFLDNDILVPPNFISIHYNEHLKTNNLVLSQCRRFLTIFDYDLVEAELRNNFSILNTLPWYQDERLYFNPNHSKWRFVFSHTLSLKKNDFFKVKGFDKKYGNNWGFEDLDLGYKLYKNECKIKFIKTPEVYHQPHFSQSVTEQSTSFTNINLFLKNHNNFEVDVWLVYANIQDKIYYSIKRFIGNYKKIGVFESLYFDLILGCVKDRFNSNQRFILGCSIPLPTKSKKRVYVLDTILEYEDKIIKSILFEASRVSESIYFSEKLVSKVSRIQNIFHTLGIKQKYTKNKKYLIFNEFKNYIPQTYMFLLPPVYKPQERYIYTWLAEYLIKNDKDVIIRDYHNSATIENDDFRIDDFEIINKSLTRKPIGNYLRQILFSISDVEKGFVQSDYNSYKNILFCDHEPLSSDIEKFNNTRIINRQNLRKLELLSVYYSCKKKLGNKKIIKDDNYCCFMNHGFFEDGIDLVLAIYKRIYESNKNSKLYIKILDYKKCFDNCLPWHNDSSKEYKLMPIRQKFENEIEQLMKVINTLNIPIQNIIILKQNFSISEIIELINRCDTTFITSKTDSINLELYITLLLNKPVIVSNNYEVLPEFLSKVIYLKPINKLGFDEDNSNTDYDQLYSLYSKDEIENLLSSVKRMNCTNQFSLAENEIQDILNKIFL